MNKRFTLLTALLSVVVTSIMAQPAEFLIGKTKVCVEFYTPDVVRVVKTPAGHDFHKSSLTVIAQPENVNISRKGNTLKSSGLTVKVDPRTGAVTFSAHGTTLLRERASASFEPRTDGPDAGSFRVTQAFTLDKDEAIYGLGTFQNGKMNRRGEHKLMEQSNLEDFQNVLQSIKGWGLFWDNYSRTQFDDDTAQGMSFSSEVGDCVDYYFMFGGSADGVIARMRKLSGDVPMFPLWTFGFWQCKERYKSADELLGVLNRYRQLQVPLDGIIQDWQYWGPNYLWNAMDFLADEFSNGQRMIDRVHQQHAHFMISIWASFGPMTKAYRQLNEKGLLYDFETWPQSGLTKWPPNLDYPSGVRVYNAFSPEGRAIYWQNMKGLFDMGVDGWWMDSTDPDFFNPKETDYDQKAGGDATWRRMRNAFPLATVRGVYEAQRKASEQKRVFIMTRSAFAGQQHYGSNMWSGDVASSWEMLRNQVPAGLSYSLTGNPNFNTDIGGFFCGSYNTRGGGSAPRNPQYQELFVRWMQYGLFCPIFRSHGADAPREIWQFGEKGEPVYDAIEKMIRLRYRFIPYLYSTAWQVTSADASYLRPLFSDFAADKKVWDMTDEFLFGQSILAAPILEAQYTEEKIIREDAMTGWDRKEVSDGQVVTGIDWTTPKQAEKYLPKGTVWYDFWTGKDYRGGQTLILETHFDRVPMFVRAGSILPLAPEMQYVGEKQWDNLELRVYPGADGQFMLYEDEGDNYNYERGQYTEIPIRWNDRTRTLVIGARKGQYPGMLQRRRFTVVLPGQALSAGKSVEYSGQETTVKL
ncbi:MAG: glycoside hydrolase family 31 protein [Bacteroidales bacterium]|nr:glycoside hydrolase family 31 protein [Bacteroidales bacterium]